MATNTITLKKKIETLKKGLNNKFVSASQKEKIKSQVEKLEKQVKASKQAKAPKGSSLTRLQKLVNKKKFSVYQGKGIDLKKDADQGALAVGRRVSKGIKGNQFGDAKSSKGNVYYEYRANRLDVKQPKKAQKYPKLEDGGMMAKGGKLEVGVYRVGKPTKIKPNFYEQKIVEIFDNGDISTASDYGRSLQDFKSQSYPIISVEQLNAQYKMAKGGKTKEEPMVVRGYFEDEAYEYKDGGYVAVSETSDGYWYIMSKPSTKENAELLIKMGVPRGEVGKVVTIEEAKKHGKLVGKEYLERGGTIEDRYTIYGTSDEGWFAVDKETKRQIHPSQFGRNSWETKQELLADLKSKNMAKGGGVLSNYRLTFMNDNGEKKYMTTESYNKAGAMKEGKWWEKNPDYNIAKGNYKVVSVVEVEEDEDDDKDTSSYKIRNERRRGIRGKGVTYNSDYSSYPNVFNPLGKPRYEEGGSIPNNYEGKTAEEVWSSWTLEQKNLFLEDHTAEIKRKSGDKNWHKSSARTQTFKDLPQYVKDSVIDHVFTGQYAKGGVTEKEVVESNAEMVLSQIKAVKHHAEELSRVVSTKSKIEAWVVGKIERASTDLSDITHYLEGNKDKMSMGGTVRYYTHKMDK